MEENKNFIKGGLPLGTGDFVDAAKAKENKNKLLAALDNINKIHTKKMTSETTAATTQAQNFDAVGITLDMLDKETAKSMKAEPKQEYILSSQIERDPIPAPAPAPAPMEMPMGDPIMVDNFQPIDSFEPLDASMPNDNYDLNNNFEGMDLGSPKIVLDDTQVGKKGKKTGKGKSGPTKNCTPEQIKSGKLVAWLAYIFFLIPLIFNGKNAFVRHHANEGLELNIIDAIAVGLYFAKQYVVIDNYWVNFALMIGSILSVVLIAITTIVKVFMILFAWAGKEAQTPFFGKARIIK